MHPILSRIIQEHDADKSDNPFLNFSAYVLEARRAGIDVSPLKPVWEKLRDKRRSRPGIFKRWPKGKGQSEAGKWTKQSTSNDELFGGIVPMSFLFDESTTVREIKDHGLTFGLWLTGKWTKKWWHPDTEWFAWSRPDMRGYWKLALGLPLSFIETWGMKLNIMVSNDTNMIRVKLLYLDMVGYEPAWVQKQLRRVDWGHLRGYHGSNELMKELWQLQGVCECLGRSY
jgi:hypothetical protein